MDRNTLEEEEYSASDCSRDSTSSNVTSTSDSSVSLKGLAKKQFESTKITTEIINLPKDLCEDKVVFEEFFSLQTWHGLSDPIRKHLGSFLPMFTDNIEFEKNSTIEALFSNRITRFGSCPLRKLQLKIEEGNCRPEISTLNKSVAKAERREQRFQESERLAMLTRKVSVSRERVLRNVCQNRHQAEASFPYGYQSLKPAFHGTTNALRAKKRYMQEVSSVADQLGFSDIFSEDEKCSDITSNHLPRKQRRLFGTLQGGASSPGADIRIFNTLGLKDDQTTTGYLVGPNGKILISERHYRDLLSHHKRRKIEEPDHPELDCQEIKLKEVVSRTQASAGYRRIMPLPKVAVTEEMVVSRGKVDTIQCVTTDLPVFTHPVVSVVAGSKPQPVRLFSEEVVKNSIQSSQDMFNSDESLLPSTESSIVVNEPECYIKRTRLSSDSELDKSIADTRNVSSQDTGEYNTSLQFDAHSESDSVDGTDYNTEGVPQDVNFKTENSQTTTDEFEFNDKLEQHTDIISIQPKHEKESEDSNLNEESGQSNQVSTEVLSTQEDESFDLNPSDCFDANDVAHSDSQDVEKPSYEKCMPELMQETHKCFLSLVRDMFCSTPDHRLTIDELKIKLNVWLKTPIAALNDWYHQAEDKWDDMLHSAILFLSGEFSDQPDDFVPYIEYKIQLNIYQWIGASRDSDYRLLDLCQYWLARKHDMGIKSHSKPLKVLISKQKYTLSSSSSYIDDDDGSSERTISPPPPRYPTDWSVRKATDHEVQAFRDQEKRRYENPHMSFTYKQHSYNSVVGPVKGIYTQVPGISKARGHNMLVADRPNFVTILTLVRDATARLPNGEGTRADICELLKSSQYISPTATDQVLQTIVSGALDRMHTEHDPCVKYDTKRKIWIYLHRNRTEEEFERLHHQFQGVAKHKKPVYRKSKSKESIVVAPRKTSSAPNIKTNSQSSIESEGIHSDPSMDCSSVSKSVTVLESLSSTALSPILPVPNTTTIQLRESSSILMPIPAANDDVPQKAICENNISDPQLTQQELLDDKSSKVEDIVVVKTNACKNPSSIASLRETIPIRVTSSCKIQTVQVTNTQSHIGARLTKPLNSADTIDTSFQSSLINSSRPQTSVISKKIITATVPAKSIVINTAPSTVANINNLAGAIPLQVSATGASNDGERLTHSFIMPVTLNTENASRGKFLQQSPQLNASKQIRVNNIQQTAVPAVVKTTSLLQSKNSISLLSQSPSGKCIIKPESHILAANKHPRMAPAGVSSSNVLVNNAGSVILKTDSGVCQSATENINTIALPKGQQTVLTPAQQKQILQNLLAQQHKQVLTSKSIISGQQLHSSTNIAAIVSSANIAHFTQSGPHGKGVKQMQKIPALTLSSAASITTPSAVFQTFGTGVGSPHVIQIKSNNILSATSGAKIQPVITSIKEHPQSKSIHQQQSLISKQANLPLKSEITDVGVMKQIPHMNVITEPTKSPAILVQSAASGTTVTRMLKSTAPVVQPASNIIRTSLANAINMSQGNQPMMTKVVKNIGENQIVSLDSLLPRQRLGADTALRIADPKTVKTQLIQLSGNCAAGSPIAQYAVVSQNRNIISVAQSPGQCSTPTIVTTNATKFIDPKTTQVMSTGHTSMTSGGNISIGSAIHQNGNESGMNIVQTTCIPTQHQQSKLQHTVHHVQQQNVQQVFTKLTNSPKILPTKVRNGTSFINSSAINIATIGGSPLIIASKPTIRSEGVQHNSSNIVFHNTSSSTDTANIMYGRQAVKVQGNILSQGHVNIVGAQQGNNSTTQKLMLSNQLVKVRTVPRTVQQHQMQFSFAQQPNVSKGMNTIASNVPTNANIAMVKATVTSDHQDKSSFIDVPSKTPIMATSVKAAQKVGIRLNQHTQRVVLATQGGQLVTQQILVPPGFQGGAFNIKRLKVIPVNSQQKGSIIRTQPSITTHSKTSSSAVNTTTTLPVNSSCGEGSSKLYHVYGHTGNSINDSVELSMDPNAK